jgi:hypothetical protein
MKIPLNNVFVWFLHRKVILTKDNLINRNGQGVKHVVSVITWNPYNIYSLSVHSLNYLVYYIYDFWFGST